MDFSYWNPLSRYKVVYYEQVLIHFLYLRAFYVLLVACPWQRPVCDLSCVWLREWVLESTAMNHWINTIFLITMVPRVSGFLCLLSSVGGWHIPVIRQCRQCKWRRTTLCQSSYDCSVESLEVTALVYCHPAFFCTTCHIWKTLSFGC